MDEAIKRQRKLNEKQLSVLRRRWHGHEMELKALIPVIRAKKDWDKQPEYETLRKALVRAIQPFGPRLGGPADVQEVNRDLRGAPLWNADLCGAYLEGADLSGARLADARLCKTELGEAHLFRANLWSAHLCEAKLGDAHLSEANLLCADLSGAYLVAADLSGTNLMGVKLYGADLERAILSNTQSWGDVEWNARDRLWPRVKCRFRKGKKLKASERKTIFRGNDLRNANWAGAALLKRYVEDENFLFEYERAELPVWGRVWRWLWKWSCDYERSFWLWATWAGVLAVIFAVIYWILLGCERIAFNVDKLGMEQPGFGAYLYYSVVTFTTLGFGDIVPLTNWARLVVGLEVFIGYVMLGGLISIFANKLARRA